MTRRALAMIALGALAGLFFACLPELSALKTDVGDAGDEAAVIMPVDPCGDGFIDDDAGEECDQRDAATCEGCKVACPGVVDDASAHCYYAAGTATFEIARASCPGGHVVTVGSDREAAFVDSLDAGTYWIGASYQAGGFAASVATEPGVPIDGGCPGCYGRTLEAADSGGECIVASDGRWSLAPCFDASAVTICEREPVGVRSFNCFGSLCATVKGGAKRYLLYLASEARTAEGAAVECARHDEGRLVVFDSREERERLVREIVLLVGGDREFTAWIGVANDGGAWTWDDGQPVDDGGRPSPWGAGQPVADAGRAFIRVGPFLDSQLAQATGDDTALRAFICQRK